MLTLGILGGGQLGRMLCQAALDLPVRIRVLDPDPNAPAARCCDEFVVGDFADEATVTAFGAGCDVLTIEIEHVSVAGLLALQVAGKAVYPDPAALAIIQDKGAQKEFYRRHALPTADFRLAETRADLARHRDFLPAFQKLRRGGYDGNGVRALPDAAALAGGFDAPSVLEVRVECAKELAVVCARSVGGEVRAFPVVEMVFDPHTNLVTTLVAPADLSADIAARATALAVRTCEAFNTVGLLAVELFLTPAGELLVNEVAPRPHNSGHHTMEANHVSQFQQHLRAVLGLPLGEVAPRSAAAMVNLLGAPDGGDGPAIVHGLADALALPGVSVHLYGKARTRPHRKMGHLTAVADTPAGASALAAQAAGLIRIAAA
ncbi:MAG: 5-(carboxyamino)imidazole ribonucleotide synthase [Hymenobacteraceae bacterium]|nr:5-(carboxyamino)imidazole ribonucleotide synthase [Hymenobacteraceae bacterium]